MNPAFSVIFFTTLSGAGYGLWFWLSLWAILGKPSGHGAAFAFLTGLALGAVMVSIGLLSSTVHLGKPLRAWRAFSQWRTSWLSREGVLAVATFLPWLGVVAMMVLGSSGAASLFMALFALLALGSLATVACTAMIYASLRTIPAWSHPLVPTGYVLFALHVGGLLAALLVAIAGDLGNMAGLGLLMSSFVLWRLKRRYWRDVDAAVMPVTRASALGLPRERGVQVFERPHTEANYLTKEMGFMLARKHSRRLRTIATALFTLVPALCALPLWLLPHFDAMPWLAVASVSALLGSMVERWLFFAEAKHVVMTYY